MRSSNTARAFSRKATHAAAAVQRHRQGRAIAGRLVAGGPDGRAVLGPQGDDACPLAADRQDHQPVFHQRRAAIAEAVPLAVELLDHVQRPERAAVRGVEAADAALRAGIIDAALVPGGRRPRAGIHPRRVVGPIVPLLPDRPARVGLQTDDRLGVEGLGLGVNAVADGGEAGVSAAEFPHPEHGRAVGRPALGQIGFGGAAVVVGATRTGASRRRRADSCLRRRGCREPWPAPRRARRAGRPAARTRPNGGRPAAGCRRTRPAPARPRRPRPPPAARSPWPRPPSVRSSVGWSDCSPGGL